MTIEYKSLTVLSTKQEVNTSGTLATGSPYNYYVVYSIKLPVYVKAGTLLDIKGNFETTVAKNYVWGIGCGIIIGTSASDTSTSLQDKVMPNTGFNMFNGGGAQVHGVSNVSVTYYVPDDITNGYLNFFAYPYSSSAVGGDTATFNNGHLDCIIYSA